MMIDVGAGINDVLELTLCDDLLYNQCFLKMLEMLGFKTSTKVASSTIWNISTLVQNNRLMA